MAKHSDLMLGMMLNDLAPSVEDLTRALKTLGSIHDDQPQAAELRALWRLVLLVFRSALVEHARLIGMDVTVQEQALIDKGWVPWRDLQQGSADGETADEPPLATTNQKVEGTAQPQLHLLIGEDSNVYVAVPLALNPTQLTTTKGE